MKSILFVTLWVAGALGAAVAPISTAFERPLDPRPEAIITGGALLAVAFLLRRGLRSRRSKETVERALQ